MRQDQEFTLYPYSGGDTIYLQSDKRFAVVNLRTGKGIISASNVNYPNAQKLAVHHVAMQLPDDIKTAIQKYLWENDGKQGNLGGMLQWDVKPLFAKEPICKLTTTIRAKEDLYNAGLCFAKGNEYVIPKLINSTRELINVTVINDLGEHHTIGTWWKMFDIVEPETEESEVTEPQPLYSTFIRPATIEDAKARKVCAKCGHVMYYIAKMKDIRCGCDNPHVTDFRSNMRK